MATFGAVTTRICDDLDRPSSEIGAAVQREIISAIEFYETERFWFNTEVVSITLSATNIYSFSALSVRPIEIDSFRVTDPGGSKRTLEPWSYKTLDWFDTGSGTGTPQYYALYNDGFRVWPTPNTASILSTLSMTAKYTALSADADTNVWLQDGEQLIRTHAMMVVARRKLGDHELADRLALEINSPQGILAKFRARTALGESSGTIQEW